MNLQAPLARLVLKPSVWYSMKSKVMKTTVMDYIAEPSHLPCQSNIAFFFFYGTGYFIEITNAEPWKRTKMTE